MGAVVRIHQSAGDADRELRSLLDWMRRERVPEVTVRRENPLPAEGEMGALSDALTVLGPGGAGAAVAGAIMAWLRTRRPGLKLVVRRSDGDEYEICTSSTKHADQAVARFLDEALSSGVSQSDERRSPADRPQRNPEP
ncbi:hypothetical protein ACFPJ1_27210 [Kribbella qitaiheensis]|uniref:effector-associated constant component EACC1 n=1 Tax=Kribbella qitaiheensis TaxID=1544730 RepID=UPI00360CB838